jgi:hypothetical protein
MRKNYLGFLKLILKKEEEKLKFLFLKIIYYF